MGENTARFEFLGYQGWPPLARGEGYERFIQIGAFSREIGSGENCPGEEWCWVAEIWGPYGNIYESLMTVLGLGSCMYIHYCCCSSESEKVERLNMIPFKDDFSFR